MSRASSPLSVLLLADDDAAHANTILEHIDALTTLSRHHVVTFNPRGTSGSVALDLDEFDVVVMHYSLVTINDGYLAPSFRAKLRRFGGLKVQMIQDDYRWVHEFWAMIRELGHHGALHARARARDRGRVAERRAARRREDPHARRVRPARRRLAAGAAAGRPPARHRLPRARAAVLDRPPRAGEGVDRAGCGRSRRALRPALRRRLARRCPHLRPELDGVHELGPGNARAPRAARRSPTSTARSSAASARISRGTRTRRTTTSIATCWRPTRAT